MQHQQFWTPTARGQAHTLELERRLNVPQRQWIYTSETFVPCSGLAAKLGIPDNGSAVERQELFWRQYFFDPTLWWDCRTNKKSACSSDLRHKESKEPLWLNNFYKPDWVDGQLTVLDKRIGRSAQPTSNPLLLHNDGTPTAAECQAYATAQVVNKLCANGQLTRAVDALSDLADTQCRVPTSLLYRVIRRCGAEKNLVLGRRLDDLTVKLGYGSRAFLANHLLRMYACQGRLQKAMQVFKRVATPSVFMWFSIISAHVAQGKPSEAIRLYHKMRGSSLEPNGHIFVAALQACVRADDVESGRQVHADVLESGIQHDCFVWNCLVDMYAKCGELEDARRVFDGMVTRNAVTWNAMIAGYAKCGQLEDARKLFDSLATKNAVTWTAMINGYAEHGLGSQALTLYASMEQEALVLPNSVTYACLLKACASAGSLQQGRQLHSDIVERRLLEGDVVLGNCLVNMYVKCGKLEDARKVFDSLPTRDAVTWNSMINGYAEHGLGPQALAMYASIEQDGLILANRVTYICLLKACASAGAVQQGRQLHSGIIKRDLLEGDIVLGNCLVNMYAKCGQLEDARKVFDSLSTRDAVTWNAMINGYAEHGFSSQALTLYASMEQDDMISPNSVTYACLLKACASAGTLQQGRQLHSGIIERGLLEGNVVLGSCLVNMYAKCGQLEEACEVFDSLSTKNAVTWTTMIQGYAENGLGPQALTLYGRMEQEGLILADSCMFTCLLKVCANAGALQQGRQLHAKVVETGLLEGDIGLGNCLVNMYAKCGKLEDARMVFDSLVTRDVVTWTAMISGYGTNNEGHNAIACFEEMKLAGIQPNDTTLTCLLVACSHEGLVSKGRQYFDAIVKQHGLNPTTEHYNCMVDLLGRAGHLDEAEKMLLSTGCVDNAVGLMSLLNACKSHGDIERGTRLFESLLELDPQAAAPYVLMSTMYADADRWVDVHRIERLRKLAGASKKPAEAGIEVNKHVHKFVVGEERGDISCKVRSTNERLKEEGNHVPHTKLVLKPASEKEKEDQLCGHAEKLALAFGLLNTPDGTPLLVTKNLRMCRDCHSSTEIMSRVEKRDIVVRDAYRVHRFEAGSCSCKGRH